MIKHNRLAYKLSELINRLGEKARTSSWFCRGVECYGPNAEILHTFSDQGQSIGGDRLLEITQELDCIADGYFYAYSLGDTTPWLILRATEIGIYEIKSHRAEIGRKVDLNRLALQKELLARIFQMRWPNREYTVLKKAWSRSFPRSSGYSIRAIRAITFSSL